jgi:hypothetical protein
MSHLAPCPACNRHVDVAETACPFCAAPLAESFRGQARPAPPSRRLSRAAMMAAGATLMGAGACGNNDALAGKTTTDAATDRPASRQDAHLVVAPPYGLPPGPGGTFGTGGSFGTGGTSGIGGSGGSTDAGKDGATDAAPARDAAQERTVIAIYGAPFAGGQSSDEPQS